VCLQVQTPFCEQTQVAGQAVEDSSQRARAKLEQPESIPVIRTAATDLLAIRARFALMSRPYKYRSESKATDHLHTGC
jgi:hypothetical protein